jgi:hypothetical protein
VIERDDDQDEPAEKVDINRTSGRRVHCHAPLRERVYEWISRSPENSLPVALTVFPSMTLATASDSSRGELRP